MAAKKTAELIPLCHTLLLTSVKVELELLDEESVNQLLNDEVLSRVQKNDQAESKKGGDNA